MVDLRRCYAIVLTGLLLAPALVGEGNSWQALPQVPCNQVALGEALVVDTAKLERDTLYRGAENEAMTYVVAFYDSDTMKVLSVSRYGERSDAVDVYYLRSEGMYVVEHSEVYYSAPYYVEGSEVVSRFKRYFYFCGDELKEFHYSERAAYLRDYLKEALARFSAR